MVGDSFFSSREKGFKLSNERKAPGCLDVLLGEEILPSDVAIQLIHILRIPISKVVPTHRTGTHP